MAEAVEGAGNDEGAFKTGFGDAEFFHLKGEVGVCEACAYGNVGLGEVWEEVGGAFCVGECGDVAENLVVEAGADGEAAVFAVFGGFEAVGVVVGGADVYVVFMDGFDFECAEFAVAHAGVAGQKEHHFGAGICPVGLGQLVEFPGGEDVAGGYHAVECGVGGGVGADCIG